MSPRRSQTFGSGRRAAIFLNVVVMAGLALAVGALVVYLAGFTDLRRRFDLTRAGTYTLSQETIHLIESLDRDVEIIAVDDGVVQWWDPEGVLPKAMEFTNDLLQEYRVRSKGRLSVEHVNAARDTVRVTDLYRELELRATNVVVVRSGESRRILGVIGDLADIDVSQVQMGGRPVLRSYRVEEALSSAIYEVTQEKRHKVYVSTGHGELSTAQGEALGASWFAATLVQDNLAVEPLSLFQLKRVPQDADLVVLLAPREDLVPEEVAALDEYLRRGGRLLVADDAENGTKSLDPLWERVGLLLDRDLVCDTQKGALRGSDPAGHVIGPRAPGDYGRHPITDALRADNETVLVIKSGAVAPTPEKAGRFTSLLLSNVNAFQDKNGDLIHQPRDEDAGQRCLGALFEPDGDYQGARVVFLPSMPWVTNQVLAAATGNQKFLRRTVAYLVGKSRTIRLPPRTPTRPREDLRPQEYDEIFRYVVIWLPVGALVLAVMVWLARRR